MPPHVQNLHPAEVREQFGRAVSAARHKRRLTQEQAADLLGMSRRKLLDIEAGRIELARYEKAGILDVLAAEPALAVPSCFRRVIVGPHNKPRAWIDLEERPGGQWMSAGGYDMGRHGGLEIFRGPYGSREAAERNAASFLRDMLRGRGVPGIAQHVGILFGLPSSRRTTC